MNGTMEDNEISNLSEASGEVIFPQETKDLIDHGPSNDPRNTIIIYLGRDSRHGSVASLSLCRDVGLEGHGALVLAGFGCLFCLLIEMILDAKRLLALGADDALGAAVGE